MEGHALRRADPRRDSRTRSPRADFVPLDSSNLDFFIVYFFVRVLGDAREGDRPLISKRK